jgi:hypothetical protein
VLIPQGTRLRLPSWPLVTNVSYRCQSLTVRCLCACLQDIAKAAASKHADVLGALAAEKAGLQQQLEQARTDVKAKAGELLQAATEVKASNKQVGDTPQARSKHLAAPLPLSFTSSAGCTLNDCMAYLPCAAHNCPPHNLQLPLQQTDVA